MTEIEILHIISMLSGVLGLAVAISLILVPKALGKVEKGLDRNFSTDKLEKMLNERRNVTEVLLKHPRVFGAILMVISFLLVLSSLIIF
ncbi:MAG: hypothetical protein WC732_05180 [Candidatus Omnitrophota bacterium]